MSASATINGHGRVVVIVVVVKSNSEQTFMFW